MNLVSTDFFRTFSVPLALAAQLSGVLKMVMRPNFTGRLHLNSFCILPSSFCLSLRATSSNHKSNIANP